MDKTELTNKVANLFRISGHKVSVSIKVNHREIDVLAEELQGIVRKTVLIECADYAKSVGVDKIQMDINKLEAAKEYLGSRAVLMHVSSNGYSPEASGYARDRGIDIFTFEDLERMIINFEPYIEAVENDKIRNTILREYQPNRMHFERNQAASAGSLDFLDDWLKKNENWLTVLGDYGVGKSWTLKRYLYHRIEKYKADPQNELLPFFIPLQRFTKAFDFESLIIGTFQMYGLSGVYLSALDYLIKKGKILFLLDSFDEMAQHLAKDTIRENLKEILNIISGSSKAIMTSRPNYFEGRAERLLVVEINGQLEWHPDDQTHYEHQNAISRLINDRLGKSQFARINDLTITQRRKLFETVLGRESQAYHTLMNLFNRFQELENFSERAVIARLLTSVAETVAQSEANVTSSEISVIPETLEIINQASIFEIIVRNLLVRDQNIGSLSAAQRLHFLKQFAIFLQQPNRDLFAKPDELRNIVSEIFENDLKRTDTPAQLLESYYRTCRRHSGLTTEGQFFDTTGNLDFPVDEIDTESRVGFSHNSLREFLVAECLVDFIVDETESFEHYKNLTSITLSDLIVTFIGLKTEYNHDLIPAIAEKYTSKKDSKIGEMLFKIIFRLVQLNPQENIAMLGTPPYIGYKDLSMMDFSGIPLSNANFSGSLIGETDFRKSDLRYANFEGCIIEKAMFDEALLKGADFSKAELNSIFVFDEFKTNTSAVLKGKECRQWLYTNGAIVSPADDLNPLLGKPWYEAAREVTRTLERNLSGTHQDVSLSKGTDLKHREFAADFVNFLIRSGVLEKIVKSKTGPGWVVKVHPDHRETITKFSKDGVISDQLRKFFERRLVEGENLDNL